MDAGLSALLGTALGIAGTLLTTAYSHHLQTKKTRTLDAIRKQRLKQMLDGGRYKWRSLETLCDAIGADEETTASLLLEIGARRSMAQGRDSWGLISRNPFPDDKVVRASQPAKIGQKV